MNPDENAAESANYNTIHTVIISLLALGATFALSGMELPFNIKAVIFSMVVTVYLCAYALVLRRSEKKINTSDDFESAENPFDAEIDEKLKVLEEASEFFAASLKPADMFRLVSGRIGDIIPFSSCVLYFLSDEKTHLTISQASGSNAQSFKNLTILNGEGLAGKVLQTERAQRDERLSEDRKVFARETIADLKSSIAVPLRRDGEIFGVLQLFGAGEKSFDENSLLLLEAIGERIVPLLNGSLSFERNLSSALTDSLTALPNERAFYVILENQIAEAIRLPEKRNLAVLVMDIKNFGELNKNYGHAVGDRILAFTAHTIKTQLRQMDFLARSANDEFFAVLPTANSFITESIIRRVEKSFVQERFQISGDEFVNIGLNFGFASFNSDGETANQLLKTALIKKRQAKSFDSENVIWFPKEFVN